MGSGGLFQPLLRDLLAVHADQLPFLDRIPGRQRAVPEHAQRAAVAPLLRHAALRLRELAHLAHGRTPKPGAAFPSHGASITSRCAPAGQSRPLALRIASTMPPMIS